MSTQRTSRTLLVAFHRIGDLTISTPLLRAIARRRRLSLLTRPFGAPLLQEQSYIERVWTLDYPNRGSSRVGQLLLGGHRRALGRRLAAHGYDEVLIYATERDVIRRWLGDYLPHRVREIARHGPDGTHISALCRMGAESVGCDMREYDPDPLLEVSAAAATRAKERLTGLGPRIVGVQTGSQRTHAPRLLNRRPNLKAPSTAQLRRLLSRIIAEDHADAIAWHGASNERPLVRRLIAGLPAEVRSQCHDLTDVRLDLLPAVLAEHRALISVDTGTAHIAAAVQCPLLVFFGPTDPAVFAPRGKGAIEVLVGSAPCQFCHGTALYKRCRDNICLNRLEHGTLWDAWMRLYRKVEATRPRAER